MFEINPLISLVILMILVFYFQTYLKWFNNTINTFWTLSVILVVNIYCQVSS